MKMKKLTALALAGVLCLGMSTTAFAAPSLQTGDGDVTILDSEGKESDKQLYNKDKQEIDAPNVWTEEIDASKYDEAFLESEYEVWRDNDSKVGNQALKDAVQAAGGTFDKNAQVVYLDEVDVKSDVDFEKANKDGIEVLRLKFDMSGYKINPADGYGDATELTDEDTVYLMHWVDATKEWVCIKADLIYEKGVLYAYANFETKNGLSPVVFVATRGTVTDPDTNEPGTNVRPGDDVTPDDIVGGNTNGTVSIDDIANAVVNKLQAANVKAVRTVRTGVSPKTGE